MYNQEDLKQFAHEAISMMLSYNVSKFEAALYLTNQIELIKCSYELHCCIFDQDPIGYLRDCNNYRKTNGEK